MNKYNQEHYNDPTPKKALEKVIKDKTKKDDDEAVNNVVEVVIRGEPVAQGRPRFSRHGGFVSVRDPEKSKSYKQLIYTELLAQLTARKAKQFPKEHPLFACIISYRHIPKDFRKSRREEAENGDELPVTKPDTDNYIKIALDALNKLLFRDDSAVTTIFSEKRYSSNPRMEITVCSRKNKDCVRRLIQEAIGDEKRNVDD